MNAHAVHSCRPFVGHHSSVCVIAIVTMDNPLHQMVRLGLWGRTRRSTAVSHIRPRYGSAFSGVGVALIGCLHFAVCRVIGLSVFCLGIWSFAAKGCSYYDLC